MREGATGEKAGQERGGRTASRILFSVRPSWGPLDYGAYSWI
jgi:hypothetical protein